MPSTANPTSIGSAGKAPTKSVSVTALRSAPDTFTGTGASLVQHTGTGLTPVDVANNQYGGAGSGAGSIESKISNLDSSVRRRKVFSAVLGPTVGSTAEADYVDTAGLTALLTKAADPITGSQNSNAGMHVAIRFGTYTVSTTWSSKVSMFGVMQGTARPNIDYTGAADLVSFSSGQGFELVENINFGCTSTGRWRLGRTSSLNNNLRLAYNCSYEGVVIPVFYGDTTFEECDFTAASTLTSNYNVEINGNFVGELSYKGCHFTDVSSSAAAPTSAAVVYIHDISSTGEILFEACTFEVTADTAALIEIVNSTVRVIFRGCHFVSSSRSATARFLIIVSDSNNVQFQNCTMNSTGPAMSILDSGCIIDGFSVSSSSTGDSTVDPTYFHFRGQPDFTGTDEHVWVDITDFTLSVIGRTSANPCVFIEDLVRGGIVRVTTRSTPWLGAGNFLRIEKSLTTPNHQVSNFEQIFLDLGGCSSSVTNPAFYCTGAPVGNAFENVHQVHIGALNVVNIENPDAAVLVTLNGATKIDNLTLEWGEGSAIRNDLPWVTMPGVNNEIGYLTIDSIGAGLDAENSQPSMVDMSGDRNKILGGIIHKDNTFMTQVSIVNVSGDFCELCNFHIVIDRTLIILSQAYVYVRGDGFKMDNCLLFGGSFNGSVFLDIDGQAAQITNNLLRCSSTTFGNIAGDGHVINGNRFSAQSPPVLNVTATNCAPATLSDTNVFVAQLTFPLPIT